MIKQVNLKIAVLIPSLIIAGIIASPFVYAAVEPHIILVMDSAQTTQPLTIQNNTGTDLFVVGTNGEVNGVISLTIQTPEATVYSVAAGNDFNNPIIVQEWAFTGKSIYPGGDYYTISLDPVVSVIGQRDSGAGACWYGWYDDVAGTWNSRAVGSLTYASYNHGTASSGEAWLDEGSDSIAFILFNSDGATTCSFKSMVASHEIIIGADMGIYTTQ